MWLPLACPTPRTCPATQACSLTGNWAGDSLVGRLALSPLSHTSWGLFSNCTYRITLVSLKQGYQSNFQRGPHQLRGCLQRTEIILGLYKCNYSLTLRSWNDIQSFEGNSEADVVPGENESWRPWFRGSSMFCFVLILRYRLLEVSSKGPPKGFYTPWSCPSRERIAWSIYNWKIWVHAFSSLELDSNTITK